MKTPYHQAPVISGPVSLDVKPVLGKRVSFWKQPLVSLLHEHLVGYPTPSNLTYIWGFGSLAGVCLLLQIVSGVFLAIHYTPSVDFAFLSVEHIIRDVYGGWLLRYMHANGASFFFIVAYLHILRSLYYGSYISPRELVWIIGVAILLLIITTAFIGYCNYIFSISNPGGR
jgi:ubiquinol-cytochrome c reductase cytochrome b subunit